MSHAPAARVSARATPRLARALTLAAALGAALAGRAGAQAEMGAPYPSRCGSGIPESEARGYVPLPRGDVFCPLVADPKGLRSFASYQRGDAREFARNIASVGVADAFGLLRFGGARPGDGVQVGLSAGVFAQFDLDARSYDLINADYLIGLPITFRRGGLSGRVRVYHQSSHLGDEFLLREGRPDGFERENLSFESVELLLSQDVGALRLYAGGEGFFNRNPSTLAARLAHGGAELRPAASVGFGTLGRARVLAAVDVKVVDDDEARTGVSARAGLEVGRPREGGVPSRRWSLLYEFYDGPSPYGQFFGTNVRLNGVGFHFSL